MEGALMSFTLSPRCSGWAAALATVLLWSGFFLSLRLGAEEKLPPQALALPRRRKPSQGLQPLVRVLRLPAQQRLLPRLRLPPPGRRC